VCGYAGVKLLAPFLLGLLLAIPPAQASVVAARQARAALGPGVWARVLRVENNNPRSQYPRTVYATVFEFAGLLWFYTETDGTQSFSLHRGMLAGEKADFRPLLRDIDPGFAAFEVLPDSDPLFARSAEALPNGCFIESVAALHASLERGERIQGAALLSYYIESGGRMHGHTVLAYETPAGLRVVDSAQSRRPMAVGAGSLASAPLKIARALNAGGVVRANWVPVPLASEVSGSDFATATLPATRADGATGAAWTDAVTREQIMDRALPCEGGIIWSRAGLNPPRFQSCAVTPFGDHWHYPVRG